MNENQQLPDTSADGLISFDEGHVVWISEKNNSFTLDQKTWYAGKDKYTIPQIMSKGDFVKVKFELRGSTRIVLDIEVEKTNSTDSDKTDHIVTIGDKKFITYAGLLKKSQGLVKEMLVVRETVDLAAKSAWCVVKVIMKDQRVFEAIGSGTPENIGTMTKKHFIEMAHTRAKSRALRDALGIDMVALEELADEDRTESKKKEKKKDAKS